MEDIDLISIWQAQSRQLERTLAINTHLLKELTKQKAQHAMASLKDLKKTGIVVSVFYLLFLGYLLYYAFSNYSSAWNYFIVSVGIILIINVKAFADYIRHLVWANRINYDGSILTIQKELAGLQLSIIQHAKTMCLQFPFFTTFYLSDNWFPSEIGWGYMVFQCLLTGAFTVLSYWLYQQHNVENLDKAWFRNMLAGSGGKSVMDAMAFYKELEQFSIETD